MRMTYFKSQEPSYIYDKKNKNDNTRNEFHGFIPRQCNVYKDSSQNYLD